MLKVYTRFIAILFCDCTIVARVRVDEAGYRAQVLCTLDLGVTRT